jgi:hypothetical protein
MQEKYEREMQIQKHMQEKEQQKQLNKYAIANNGPEIFNTMTRRNT